MADQRQWERRLSHGAFGADWGQGDVLAQHLAAAFVHHAGGGADVGVAIAGNVFLNEIDETGLALEQAQQLQGGACAQAARPAHSVALLAEQLYRAALVAEPASAPVLYNLAGVLNDWMKRVD